jgi:hypothetical protein
MKLALAPRPLMIYCALRQFYPLDREFRNMEGAELEATPCSSLVCRYVRRCRTRLRCVYHYRFPFLGWEG